MTLDADTIRLDGECFVDRRPLRGTFAYTCTEVEQIAFGQHEIELQLTGGRSLALGRFWTVKPSFDQVGRTLVEWHRQQPLPAVLMPATVEAASTLDYATPSVDCGVQVIRSAGTIRMIVTTFGRSGNNGPAFDERLPGFSSLAAWLLAAVRRKRSGRGRPFSAALELVLTPSEFWVLSRSEREDRFARYRRDDIVEFRRNKFDDGLYMRVEHAFADDLPGTDRFGQLITPLVLEVFGSQLAGNGTSVDSATQLSA